MMMNRKVSSIYSKIWLSGPQSPLPPGKTVTTFFPPSFIHSTSATLSHYMPISVLGAADTAGISETHPCPCVEIMIG